MTQFVYNNVVQHFRRCKDQPEIEIQIPGLTAAAPACLLVTHGNPSIRHTDLPRKIRCSLRQHRFCPFTKLLFLCRIQMDTCLLPHFFPLLHFSLLHANPRRLFRQKAQNTVLWHTQRCTCNDRSVCTDLYRKRLSAAAYQQYRKPCNFHKLLFWHESSLLRKPATGHR